LAEIDRILELLLGTSPILHKELQQTTPPSQSLPWYLLQGVHPFIIRHDPIGKPTNHREYLTPIPVSPSNFIDMSLNPIKIPLWKGRMLSRSSAMYLLKSPCHGIPGALHLRKGL